jgi:phosphotriesterase-related protein
MNMRGKSSHVDGDIQTVLGPVPARELGPFLAHEHLLTNLVPKDTFPPDTPRVEISLTNIWDIRYQWCDHFGNQILDDRALMISELQKFSQDGGGCLVEQTSRGIKPDPAGLAEISRESKVSVVAGTGFYTVEFAGHLLAELDQKQIGRLLLDDLYKGMAGTDIRAGFIGEMGLSTPPHPYEIKALKAAAQTQSQTGVGICIHPPRDPAAPHKILELISKNGGQVGKTAIAHLERTLPTIEDYLALAQTGCYLELDFFGIESGFYPFAPVDLPNDAGRLAIIKALIERGHLEQILISQDICHLSRLRRYGGEGYGHIFRNVVPMMLSRGFKQAEIDAILTENPRRFLVAG